ncbi:MAG: hypothetical protein PHI66_02480 [Candidatus Pacebacteria bacterium]|nr:hypothetical protein [Candidatus Paceibacterota bacterium]
MAYACHFTIWPNDRTGYDIRVVESGFFCRDGSDSTTGFYGSEPITYEELIHIIYKYDNPSGSYAVINNFIKDFFSIGGVVLDRWLSKINEIIEKPISDEEYGNLDKIIVDNKKQTALGWLAKVEKFSHSRLYSPPIAEEYIEKAKQIWPQVDISGAEQIIKDKEVL